MYSNNFIASSVDFLVTFATDWLIPLMLTGFCVGVVLKVVLYYTQKRELGFSEELHKRVNKYLDDEGHKSEKPSFYNLAKHLLVKNFYEVFEVRTIMKRRKPDFIMSHTDRWFLIELGCAKLVKDTLKQIKHLKYNTGGNPKFLEMSKSVYQKNGSLNKVFGIIPSTLVNDFVGILPGLFIIAGILGTFLGIMKALPELGAMDIGNVEASQQVMDTFLLKISFSMSTSIIGIVLSGITTVINTLLNADKIYIQSIETFENSLDLVWSHCENNAHDTISQTEEYDDVAMKTIERVLNKDYFEELSDIEDDETTNKIEDDSVTHLNIKNEEPSSSDIDDNKKVS